MATNRNIKNIDRIRKRNRRIRTVGLIWFLFIVSTVLGLITLNEGFIYFSYYFFGFDLLALIVLVCRYGLHKNI